MGHLFARQQLGLGKGPHGGVVNKIRAVNDQVLNVLMCLIQFTFVRVHAHDLIHINKNMKL